MRSIVKILLYLLVVVLIAAVLSPPIYWLANGFLDYPFYRYFSRTAQVTAIILLVPLLFWLRIRSVSEFGLTKNPRGGWDVLSGFLLAFLPVVLLAAGLLYFDVYAFRKDLETVEVLKAIRKIALTAGVVAMIEEFLFRGVVLGLTVKAFGAWRGAFLVSAVFAGVHFLKPAKQIDPAVMWWTGFAQIPRVLDNAPPPILFFLGFLSLFLVGLVLAMATLKTRSLWLPIGLHAGWVFGQQGFMALAKYQSKQPDAFLPWVGANVVSGAVPTGLVPLFVLLLTGGAVWLYLRYVASIQNRPRHSSNPA